MEEPFAELLRRLSVRTEPSFALPCPSSAPGLPEMPGGPSQPGRAVRRGHPGCRGVRGAAPAEAGLGQRFLSLSRSLAPTWGGGASPGAVGRRGSGWGRGPGWAGGAVPCRYPTPGLTEAAGAGEPGQIPLPGRAGLRTPARQHGQRGLTTTPGLGQGARDGVLCPGRGLRGFFGLARGQAAGPPADDAPFAGGLSRCCALPAALHGRPAAGWGRGTAGGMPSG